MSHVFEHKFCISMYDEDVYDYTMDFVQWTCMGAYIYDIDGLVLILILCIDVCVMRYRWTCIDMDIVY